MLELQNVEPESGSGLSLPVSGRRDDLRRAVVQAAHAQHVGVTDDRHEQSGRYGDGHTEWTSSSSTVTPSVEALSIGDSPSAWTVAAWMKSVTEMSEPRFLRRREA